MFGTQEVMYYWLGNWKGKVDGNNYLFDRQMAEL